MLSEEKISKIASDLNVSGKEVIEMDSRLSQSDVSLNNLVDSDSEDCEEVGNLIASSQENQEEIIIKKQQFEQRKTIFDKAFSSLNEREKDILIKRQLTDNPSTLEELSKFYNISRERIRQIEENAMNKIKKEVKLQFAIS
jgi:RNA polymerase sigma-32 factor